MAQKDAGRTGITAAAVLAVALILLPAMTADASCSAGNRVDHRDAECLSAWWKNRGVLKKSRFHVRNKCPEYGKVVAKVDLKSAMDRTLLLNDGLPRDGGTRHRIRGISCCSDIGALCNRSDVVSDAGCLARFRRVSPANRSCGSVTVTAVISGENYDCRISAICMIRGTMFLDRRSTISVPRLDLDEVHNCNGRLTRGPCPRPQSGASWLSVSDARHDHGHRRPSQPSVARRRGGGGAGRLAVDRLNRGSGPGGGLPVAERPLDRLHACAGRRFA